MSAYDPLRTLDENCIKHLMTGIVLLTLGALNALLALSVETCTQGDADSLYGGWITLVLYVAGFFALNTKPSSPWLYLGLIPAAAIAVWHSVFAAEFAWGFWARGMSACYAMTGGFTPAEAGEWMDGGEPLLTALWLGVSVAFWSAVFRGFRFSRAMSGATEEQS